MNRRRFLALTGAGVASRAIPAAVQTPSTRRVLTLVWDKAAGAMRAVERVVSK